MANYKIKSNAFGNKTISKVHLNADAADWVTSDGIKNLGTFDTFDSLISKLSEMYGKDHTDVSAKNYLGHFRAQHSSSFFYIMNNCTYYLGDLWVQSITGNLKLEDGNLSITSDNIGTFVRKHNAEGWSKWEISNNSEIVDESSEIMLRLQGNSKKSNSTLDAFKWLGKFDTYDSLNDALDNLIFDSSKVGSNYGYFRANVLDYRQLEIKNLLISSSKNYIVQIVSGCFTIKNKQIADIDKYTGPNNEIAEGINTYTIATRIHRNGVWENWKIVSDSKGTTQTVSYSPDSIIDYLNKDNGASDDDQDSGIEMNFTPYLSNGIPYNTGNYISLSSTGTSSLELKVYALNWNKKIFMQSVFGPITLNSDNKLVWINGLEFGEFYRTSSIVNDKLTWGEWKIVNYKNIQSLISVEQHRAEVAEEELLKRLQGTSDNSNGVKDPFKFLGNFDSVSKIEERLDTMNASGNSGVFRAVLAGYISIIIVNNPMDTSKGIWNQTVMGCLSTYNSDDKKIKLKNNWYNYSVLYRTSSKEKGWGDWKIADEDRIKDLIKEISEKDVDSLKEELIKYVKGNNTSAWEYPFKKLNDFNTTATDAGLQILDKELQNWHGGSITDTEKFVGNFRTNVDGIPIEIFSTVLEYDEKGKSSVSDTSVWVQEIRGVIDIDCGSINHLGKDGEYGYNQTDVPNGATPACSRTYKRDLRFSNPLNNTGCVNTLRRVFIGSLGGWGDWINTTNPYITSPLYGKNVLLLGGSFAHNTRSYTNNTNTGFGFDEQDRKYGLQNYIAKSLGLKRFDNFALAGKGVCIDAFTTIETKTDNSDSDEITKDYSIYGQLTRAIKWSNEKNYTYDAIIIMGGINDYDKDVKLGYISNPMGNDTFYGSYKKIIDTARKYNKDVKLYMTTPFKAFHSDTYWAPQSTRTNGVGVRYQDYVQALKVISQYKSVPLLDIFGIQQVDTTNFSKFYRVNSSDATHPNGMGYKMIAPAMIEFLAWGKGMCTFDFDVLSYKNRANIKENENSIKEEAERAKNEEKELLSRLQGTSDKSSAWGDSFKKIKDFGSLKDLDSYLQDWHGGYDIDAPVTKGFVGNFRTNVAGVPIEIFSSVVSYGDKIDKVGDTNVWVQEIKGAVDIDKGAVNHLGDESKRGYIDTSYTVNGRTWYGREYKQGLRFVSTDNATCIHTLRRIYNGSLGGWGEWIDINNPYITSPLYGKNILILGGSFAHNMKAYNSGKIDGEGNNVIDGNKNSGFGFDIEDRKYSFQNYIAKELGLKRFDNFAVATNGACIDNEDFKYNIYKQLESAISCANKNNYKYDAIILAGGINDYQAHSPLGVLSESMRDNTFYGSYKKIINKARIAYPDAKLFMTTPFKAFHITECWDSTSTIVNSVGCRYYDYLQALKDIAQWASIPLLDIFAIQQVDLNTASLYYRFESGDKTHPNGKGYLQIANAMLEFLAWGKGASTFDNEALTLKLNDKITDVEFELLQRLRGQSENNVNFDPFIKLSWVPKNKISEQDIEQDSDSEQDEELDINKYMNALYPTQDNYAIKTGYFRAYSKSGTSCLDIKVDVLSWGNETAGIKERFMQTVSGPVTLINDNTELCWVNGVPKFGPGHYYRVSEDGEWSEWKPVNNHIIEQLQNQIKELQEKIDLINSKIN